jgi:hypothetical protein
VALSTFLLLAILNTAASAYLRLKAPSLDDAVVPENLWNPVTDRYGEEAVLASYPGMSAPDVRRLLHEIWSRPRQFEPFTQFREEPVEGKFVHVDKEGFRRSSNQGPWPPSPDALNTFVFGGSTTFGYGLPDDQRACPGHR